MSLSGKLSPVDLSAGICCRLITAVILSELLSASACSFPCPLIFISYSSCCRGGGWICLPQFSLVDWQEVQIVVPHHQLVCHLSRQ